MLLDRLRSVLTPAAHWVDLQWSVTVEQLRDVAPKARGRLLDVGCGNKPYEHIFSAYVDEYVGLEREDSFARTAAASSAAPDVFYDGTRIPFADESFDTVLCIQVLEHTSDPEQLVRELARVLRKDGLLILSAPFAFRLHEEPHDYFRYTPHGLEALCRKAELDIVEVRSQGSLWSVMGHAFNAFLAFRVASLEGVLQALGKLTHERESPAKPRLLRASLVLPAMVLVSATARMADRVIPDTTMVLGFQVLARRKPGA